jgi:hypothetical protein
MSTQILLLPKIDGLNTEFVVPNNADWLDGMFFSAPGFTGVVLLTVSLTVGSNIGTAASVQGLVPGMLISPVPGIPQGTYIGAVPTTTTFTMVNGSGSPVNATVTDAEAEVSFEPIPLDLSGIQFVANLRTTQGGPQNFLTAQTADNTMINGQLAGTLAFNVPRLPRTLNGANMSMVPPGTYQLDIIAIADGYTINLMPESPATVIVTPGVTDPAT